MTDASTRPSATPFDDGPIDLPPMPPPRRRRPAVPAASWPTLVLIVLGAVQADLAVQGRIASVAGLLAIGFAGLVVLAVPDRRTGRTVAAVALALTAGSNLVLRASDWVTGPAAIAALSLLGLAALDQVVAIRLSRLATTGRTIGDGLIGSVRYLVGPLVGWLGPADERRAARLRGGAVAAAVTVLLTLLLANADVIVGQSITATFRSSAWEHVAFTASLTIAFATVAIVSHEEPGDDVRSWEPGERPIEATMGLSAMVAVLATWVAIQAAVALGGADRLLATASVTRAEYAREGFFELVAVVVVVIGLLALFARLLGSHRRLGSPLLIAAVGSLTLALVGITYSRLALYIDAFGLTMLRLSVAWFLGWLGILVVAVTARRAGLGGDRAWLTTFTVVSAALAVTAFGWSNPEAMVASTNLDRDNAVVRLDTAHLQSLGPDAAQRLRSADVEPGTACPDDVHPFGPFGWNRAWAEACPGGS